MLPDAVAISGILHAHACALAPRKMLKMNFMIVVMLLRDQILTGTKWVSYMRCNAVRCALANRCLFHGLKSSGNGRAKCAQGTLEPKR